MTLKNNIAVKSHLAAFLPSNFSHDATKIIIFLLNSREKFRKISQKNSRTKILQREKNYFHPKKADIYLISLSNAFRTTISKHRRMKTENYFLLISTCEIGRWDLERKALVCAWESGQCFCLHSAFAAREKMDKSSLNKYCRSVWMSASS